MILEEGVYKICLSMRKVRIYLKIKIIEKTQAKAAAISPQDQFKLLGPETKVCTVY